MFCINQRIVCKIISTPKKLSVCLKSFAKLGAWMKAFWECMRTFVRKRYPNLCLNVHLHICIYIYKCIYSISLSLYLRMHFFGKPFQVTAATWNKTGLLRTQLDLVFAHCLNGVQPNILIHSANASRLTPLLQVPGHLHLWPSQFVINIKFAFFWFSNHD